MRRVEEEAEKDEVEKLRYNEKKKGCKLRGIIVLDVKSDSGKGRGRE